MFKLFTIYPTLQHALRVLCGFGLPLLIAAVTLDLYIRDFTHSQWSQHLGESQGPRRCQLWRKSGSSADFMLQGIKRRKMVALGKIEFC